MIINKGEAIRTYKGLEAGLRYQTREEEPEKQQKAFIVDGDPELVKQLAKTITGNYVAFPILLSWKESPQEFREKLREIARRKGREMTAEADFKRELRELWEEIKSLLFAGYQEGELFYTAIAHEDTDNFHIHIYVLNTFANTGKTIRLWYSPQDIQLIRDYIDAKYGFDRGKKRDLALSRKEELLRRLGKAKDYGIVALKEELHSIITEQIQAGVINNAKELREFLQELGATITRHGDGYIGLAFGDVRLRLKGEIYGKNWEKRNAPQEDPLDLEELERRVEEYRRKMEERVQKQYAKDRERLRKEEEQTDINPKLTKEEALEMLEKIDTPTELKKAIPLPNLMAYLGLDFYHGTSTQGEYIQARVPWREDRHPSFFASFNKDRWLWIDLARNEGGSVIDFVMRYLNLSYPEAVRWLREKKEEILRAEVVEKKGGLRESSPKVEIRDIRPPSEQIKKLLKRVWELDYIPEWLKVGTLYKKVVKYREGKHGEKIKEEHLREHYLPVLVFEDGFIFWRSIIPDEDDKGAIGTVKPSLIKNGSQKVYVVEGLTDALAISQIDPQADILILHSVANINKMPDLSQYKEIVVATDNDPAGEEAYRKIKERYRHTTKRLYFEGKDVMEYWLRKKAKKEGQTDEEDLSPPRPRPGL